MSRLEPGLRSLLPRVCGAFQPSAEMRGANREEALAYLAGLEASTAPGP